MCIYDQLKMNILSYYIYNQLKMILYDYYLVLERLGLIQKNDEHLCTVGLGPSPLIRKSQLVWLWYMFMCTCFDYVWDVHHQIPRGKWCGNQKNRFWYILGIPYFEIDQHIVSFCKIQCSPSSVSCVNTAIMIVDHAWPCWAMFWFSRGQLVPHRPSSESSGRFLK